MVPDPPDTPSPSSTVSAEFDSPHLSNSAETVDVGGAGVSLELLVAGATSHPGWVARRGAGRRPVRFPALVAVVRHPGGVVLVDTGYAPRVVDALSRGLDRVYGRLLPVSVTPEEAAVAQLAQRGIRAEDVTHVVLTHLHADHVAGLRDFPRASVVVRRAAVEQAVRIRGVARLRRGLVPSLLPDDLADRVLDPATLPPASPSDAAALAPLDGARDLLGDGAVLVVPLPGHAAGHLGVRVRAPGVDVLLVGDAAWDVRAVSHGELPHPVARLVTDDWRAYWNTLADLRTLLARRPDLLCVPSHDEARLADARARLAEAAR